MTPKRFSELARCAFVQAAANSSRFGNGRVNHSRVAAQTGLSRADVKRSLKYNVSESPRPGGTPVERVIDGWRGDRQFGKRGRPRRLKISGRSQSFARLVKQYGGDVPHRAVLDELRRIGAVRLDEQTVVLRLPPRTRHRHDLAFLSPLVPALIDGLRIVSGNAGPGKFPSIHRLSFPAESESDLEIVRHRCVASARAMLDGLGRSFSKQLTIPARGRRPEYLFTVTVLLAENRIKSSFTRSMKLRYTQYRGPRRN